MKDFFSALGITKNDLLTKDQALRHLQQNRRGFYVYSLWRLVDGHPQPFYIGKGHGIRVSMHFRPSQRTTNNPLKDRLMEEMRSAGEEPLVGFIAIALDEQAALKIEADCINRIGRRNRGTGPLVNMTDGGSGVPGNSNRIAVFAENQLFFSMADADRALGLGSGQTRRRVHQGWPGYCFVVGEPKPCRKGRRTGKDHHKTKVVFADHKRYEMMTEAAKALGVYPSVIYKRIQAGWPGYYLESDGQKERKVPKRNSPEHLSSMRKKTNNKWVKVIVDGVTYRSFSAAASALGLCYATVRNRCRDGRYSNYTTA